MELSYSLHLGNDKSKSIKARREAKNTPSGTVNRSNNAIQNIRQLGKVNHHNLRQYDNNQEQIKTIKGSNNIVKDVKELYLDLFEEARLEYNNKQIRDDRKIYDYFYKISDDTKHDLACEIIIELGDMAYWEDKTIEYKYEMTKVFEKQIDDLKEIVPEFYVANATIHFDEHSPHFHIIGVPVKENCKTGLSRQVGKTSIFTKESLVIIQDKMRERCIEDFNQESIRSMVSYVPQEHVLFSRSVYQNVALGKADETNDDEIRHAIELADFAKDISALPYGLDTIVGEYGVTYDVEGYVTNNSDKDYTYVQIEFTAYDSEGNTLGTCLDNNSGLEKGGRWKFSASCIENVDSIKSVKLKELSGY